MKIPESRFGSPRRKSPSRIFTVALIAVLAGLVVAGAVFLIRARSPIMAISQTDRPLTAIELWNEDRYEDVEAVTSEQLEDYPLDPTALSLRGFARFYLAMDAVEGEQRQGLLVGSIRDLRRVLLVPDPELEGYIHYILGKAYFQRGRFFYDSAIQELETARNLGVERLDLLEYLGLAARDIGLDEDAVAYFREAIELGDESIHRVTLGEILIGMERYRDADVLLRRAIDETSDVGVLQDALLALGQSYHLQGRYDEAIAEYQQVIAVNEASAEAHFRIGEVYLSQEEQDQARFEWREAIRLDPNHIESLQRLQEY